MKKLLPLFLILIGSGAGVGAGLFLRPELVTNPIDASKTTQDETLETSDSEQTYDHGAKVTHDDGRTDAGSDPHSNEYAKLNNQFVVPIISQDKVTALVVLALSIEVPNGRLDAVYQSEPKLRDSFLQVLFDHANVGGFEGNFTSALELGRLRKALREVAQRDLGKAIIQDVLIMEIARQDY
tara:strand:- start:171 stop:716 length:546 start_codon:yes stop_codon:yes gene_type:complete